jgi:RND family efflux transporter MFP subunit
LELRHLVSAGRAMQIPGGLLHNKPTLFAIVICTAVLIALGVTLYDRAVYVESNDATVQGHFVALGSKVAGTVERVFVEDQEKVKKGQLLCQIDDRDYRNDVVKAEQKLASEKALFALAKKDYLRSEKLFRGRYLSAQDYENARFQYEASAKDVDAAQALFDSAQVNLSYTQVRAPGDGVVAVRTAQPGMQLKVGAPLFGFVDPEERWVIAKIKETDMTDVKVGKSVDVLIDAIPHRKFE